MIYAAIMGYGTIGSGVAEILEVNKEKVAAAVGQEVALKYVLDLREFPGTPVEDKVIHDFAIIENDPEVSVVVETMGGLNPSYPFVKSCLMAGKNVVTSNKALVAAYGTELLAIARNRKVNFLFEASVGGGIPIVRTMVHSMAAENIGRITGVLNGTTNYILTEMSESGCSFGSALSEAQDLGYAERDPSADVDGYDTCRKIAILTALATKKEVDYEQIYTEGISAVTDTDFRYASELGKVIRLFGCSRIKDGSVEAWTAPVMIGPEHPLSAVGGVLNGILVESDMLDQTLLCGSGAGKLPTGSAVVADIIEALRTPGGDRTFGWSAERAIIDDFDDSVHSYFIRLAGNDDKIKAKARDAFGNVTPIELEGLDEFAIVTGPMSEADYRQKAQDLPVNAMIRVE